MTPRIRDATPGDWPSIWPIVREIVVAADTFPYDPEMTEDEGRSLWMVASPGRTTVAVDDAEVLGMRVVMEDPVLDLQSPENATAEVIIGAQEMQDAQPSFGVDVGDPAAVDAAHAEAVERGLRVVYPLTDEPWGVRRFFVEDPGGTVINVLAHII